MERWDWPEPLRTLRGHLPAEMRVLRGGLGALGGVVLFVGVFAILLGGNWQMGYAHDWVLASIFLVLIPAVIGIGSPLWYWFWRPVWVWLGRPVDNMVRPLQDARFLPGLAGSMLGAALVFPVSATSQFWVQVLAPFGLAIGLASPLWFWLLRPVAGGQVGEWIPASSGERTLLATGLRVLPSVGALLVVSVALTAVIALPVVGIGEPVTSDGLTVTVTDVRTATEVLEIDGETVHGSDAWRLLLVRVAVDNHGDAPRELPGTSVGDITVIAPECGAQNFGEPSHNCNQVHLDGDFRANGAEYVNYDTRQASVGGTVGPDDRASGWLVFRIESPPDRSPGFEAMVIVNNIGRWTLDDV